MAEALAVVTPVVDMLIQLLMKEGKSFRRVHREVKSLKDELECLQGFLKDAEERSLKEDTGEGAKAWLKQLREEAYHIEDVIDLYLLYVHLRGFSGFFQKAGYFFKALKSRLDLVSEIRDIKASLREIKDRGVSYGFNSSPQESTSRVNEVDHCSIRLGSLFIQDNEYLDIHGTNDELLTNLLEGTSTRMVISLTGMGGIGKTTLAKKVYDTKVVKAHFDCCAWITVTQSYNLEKLLGMMAKQLCPEFGIDGVEELIGRLRQFLETKRYVIVFDDVWQLDFWGVVKHALPNNDNGSRIIVTTRNDMVATSCKENYCDLTKKLQPLSREMALQLFCKKAFQFEFEGHCPQDLVELSNEIVRKCQGSPLVISSIAGLLSTKEKVLREWQKMYNTLNSELDTNPHLSSISKILSLSYYNLPTYLKPCFLYFCMFPSNRLISDSTLYQHWIAEGFIKEQRDKTSEQVAEEYLNELIQRNLVQVHALFFGGKLCHVHDLLRDIIVSRADELGFYRIVDDSKSIFRGKCRRLSVYCGAKDLSKASEAIGVRAIVLFNYEGQLTEPLMGKWFRKCKLLKVLNFTDAPITHLPKDLGNLWHLKYLNLRNTKVKALPKSIGKLKNLEALDIVKTSIFELPIEINKLRSLRHVRCFHNDNQAKMSLEKFQGLRTHKGIGSLGEMQTLTCVDVNNQGVDSIKELEMLRQLRNLGIVKLAEELGSALCFAIEKWDHLERLTLASISENEILNLQEISSPPRFLWCLNLMGRLLTFPDWILRLHNLRILSLFFSRLSADPFYYLKSMPNLERLNLHKAYDGDEVHFKEGGFQKLKLLELSELDGLKVMKIDREALPLLEELWIGYCPELKEAPSNIQHLRSLKLVKVSEVPMEFVLGMQSKGDDCCWKVKQVPFISSWSENKENVFDCL